MTPTVYYQRHGVVITEQRACIDNRHYDITRLTGLMKVRRPRHPAVAVAAVIAVAEAALAMPLVAAARSPIGLLHGVVALLIPALATLLCARWWPRETALIARYGQHRITLFATADEQEFGQVARALQRAIEAHDR